MPSSVSACPSCTRGWESWELQFSPLPLENVRMRLQDWAATLRPPAILAIEAGGDGLRIRLRLQKGSAHGSAAAWAAATRQHSCWKRVDYALQDSENLHSIVTAALLPEIAAASTEPFISIGASLLSSAARGVPVTLYIAIHGREDELQERLRALSAYAIGTEKGVDDDAPNPWTLRLRTWQSLMAVGGAAAAFGGAGHGPGWIPASYAALLVMGGGLLGLAGFMGTQHWMALRSIPAQVVEKRLSGALLRVSLAVAAVDPSGIHLLAGEQRWVRMKRLWPDILRHSFPLSSADVLSMIAPFENSEAAGMIAADSFQDLPAPPPSEAYRRAPFKIGVSIVTEEKIGIDGGGHTLVVGGSRSGKSSAVFNLLREMLSDIDRAPGLFLVDPHVSLADAFLHLVDLLPGNDRRKAIDRLRVITPHADWVMPLNPLTIQDFDWAGNALVQAGQRTWTEFWGPRMQAALLALARLVHAWNRNHPEAALGLLHTVQAAYDPEWRQQVRELLLSSQQSGIDALEALLGQAGETNKGRNAQWVTEVMSPIISKLMALELSPWLHTALHQNGFVDMEGWVKDKAWIVLRLPSGEMGREGVRLLAGIVYNIFEAAFRKVTSASPSPFNFVVDEIQEIGGAMGLESLLSEGGKFGARLFVLAQSLALLRQTDCFGTVVQALLANTSAQLFFSPDPDDAEIIREMLSLPARFGPTTIDMPTLQAWLRARLDGQWQPPTRVRVEPLIKVEKFRVLRTIDAVIRAHPESYTKGEIKPANVMEKNSQHHQHSQKSKTADPRKLGW